ncbi:AP-4 complex accessory subunit tepsin isoform X3 [Equus przewalskii]|uniref:AP-4 complex accessory subunit tepsin isoform X3 n=1 Tax=Equus przewalskii TaxID=9798 RepID=A0ABM4JIM7_EQUPR|nr:AP-4 complex accessory subunit tepsin isoform X3 [Equus caballus]
MAGTPPLRDRLSFLHRLPILLKGTSDDDVPCPGYLFEEIAKISHESLGSSQCLLEYLLNRLHSGSGRVKLKVLKIMLHLCSHGSPSFLLILKRNSTFIQEAAGSAGEAFLSTIQKAAEVVANAVRPGSESPSTRRPPPRGDAYQPAMTPSASHAHPSPGNLLPGAVPGARALRHQPGQAGGGWDEPDSSPSSQNSSQENGNLGKTSDSGSRSGSDSPSGASWAPSDLAERAEAMTLSDCQQELSLVQTVTRGSRAFLSREEAQHFVKECGLLNCEAVLELLICHLGGTSECVQMRALGAVASLGCTDLLPQEHILLLTRPRLQELSAGSPGPVTNKATKILRHFEASCRQRPPAQRPPAEPGTATTHAGPSDLLTDTVPFGGGQAFLQPLNSALFSPKGPAQPPPLQGSPLAGPGDTREAETRLAGSREQGPASEPGPSGTDTTEGVPELGPGPSGCPWSPVASGSCSSLFAGMELVACPRLLGAGTAAGEPPSAPQAPWTLSQSVAAREPPGSEPSAFAFLNS